MKTLLAVGAALGLALSVAPATAQQAGASSMTTMTATQKTSYDGWPADRRSMYDAWPAAAKTYFWTLNAQQQTGWWVLNDEQRTRIVMMTPEQRTAAWTSISSQMAGQMGTAATAATAGAAGMGASAGMNSTTGTTTTTVMPRTGAGPVGTLRFVSNARVQAVSTTAPAGTLPVCTANQQDDCINRGAR